MGAITPVDRSDHTVLTPLGEIFPSTRVSSWARREAARVLLSDWLPTTESLPEETMKIKIRAHDVDLTEDLRTHLENRLASALGGFGDQINRVIVRLSDTEGDGAGANRRCQIEVRLRPSVRVQETDSDLFAAIDRLSQRAARAVTHAIEREREPN